jgi:hypothetical protein
LVLGTSEPWDPARKVRVSRKASKYPFLNLPAANTWSTDRHTTPISLERSTGEEKGEWWEWAVASELFRRAAAFTTCHEQATSRFPPAFRDLLVCVAPNRRVAAEVVPCDDWSACAATIELAGNAHVIRTNTGTTPYFSREMTGAMRFLRPNVIFRSMSTGNARMSREEN